jgi:hypothetical protein
VNGMTESDFRCPFCSNKDPIAPSLERCPACQRDLPTPNVRAAVIDGEVKALERRIAQAKEETEARNCKNILEEFRNNIYNSEAVICRSIIDIKLLVSNPNSLFSTFYNQVSSKGRIPEQNDYDRERYAIDELFFPGYKDNIVFAALSLDGKGVLDFGPHTIVLKSEMISHRATVFERNTIEFARDNKLAASGPIPFGFRAIWDRRADLSMAKLHSKLDATTEPADYPGILLEQSADGKRADFIEVHIFQGFSRGAIARITLGKVTAKEDRLLIRSLEKALDGTGIEIRNL